MSDQRPVQVLLLEDDRASAALVCRYLREARGTPPNVVVVTTLAQALERLADGWFDLVLADLNVPDSTGVKTVESLVRATSSVVIVLTGIVNAELREQALECGAYDVVKKDEASKPALERLVRLATLQARAIASLQDSEARFRSLVMRSSDWYWEQDEELRFTLFGGAEERTQDALGKRRWEIPTIVPLSSSWAEHRALLEAREPFRDFEYSCLDESGELEYLSVSGEPVFDAAGAFRGYRGVVTDITRRKRAEQALRESEERFRGLHELSSDWYWEQDAELRLTFMSPHFEQKTGLEAGVYLGRQRWEQPAANLSEADWAAHRAQLERHEPFTDFEMERIAPDGRSAWFSLSGQPVFDESGAFRGYRGVGRDITEKKRAENLLGLEHTVTRALSQAETPAEALGVVMRAICDSQKWEAARYFEPDEAASLMRISQAWASGSEMEQLNAQWRSAEYPRGQGLIGRVWQSGEALWVQDISRDPRVAQNSLARAVGVRGAFLNPVKFEDRVIGVLSFVSTKVREPDQRMLDAMRVIASQLGQFLMRNRAEDALRESEARLRAIVDNEPECVKVLDSEGRLVDMNPAGLRMIEADSLDMVRGQAVDCIVAPEHRSRFRDLTALVIGGAEAHLEFQIVGLKGTRRWMESRAVPLPDKATGKTLMLSLTRDITERKRAQARQAAHLRYQQKLAVFGRTALDRREPGELIQGAVQSLFEGLGADVVAYIERGAGPFELVLRAVAGTLSWQLDRRRVVRTVSGPLVDALDSGTRFVADRAVLPFEWARDMRTTAIVPVHAEGVRGALCVLRSSPEPIGLEEINFVDATANLLSAGLQRIGSENRLAFLAQFDTLTGLPNRALLSDRFAQMIVHARRHGTLLGVLFIDLDAFKLVNDSFGHAAGDELLKEAGRRLRACVRVEDTVARISGDEFAVVLADLAKPEDAALVAQKIIDSLAAPFHAGDKEMFVTASVGIAAFPGDGDSAEALLGAADAAMYRAKQSGRNAHQFFTPEINQRTRARAALRSELRRALEREEFALSYQPKIDLKTGATCGAEALLRWRHPERGLVAPSEFIPVLEDTGLIVQVGEWVIAQACRDLKALQALGVAAVPVAVNLSARQFRQHDLDARIRALIQSGGIAPALIELEITESHLMHDPDHAIRVMRGLRDSGIHVAVDDFGTGYSSLAYLTRLPVSALKIDRSFVAGIEQENGDAAIVRTIIEMARTLGMTVVAEGVENAKQVAYLRRLGCDQAQGYFFSRPLPATDFAALLASDMPQDLPPADPTVIDVPREHPDLVAYLENLSGRSIKSRDDIRAYITEISVQPAANAPSAARWRVAKQALLGVLLVFAASQYYAIEILLEILSLPQLTIFAPAGNAILKSMLWALSLFA